MMLRQTEKSKEIFKYLLLPFI